MSRKFIVLRLFAAVLIATASICYGGNTVTFGSAMEVEVNGAIQQFAQNATFNVPDGPCVYKMRPVLNAGERTYAIKGNDIVYRYPVRGDGNWVRVAFADNDAAVTLTGIKVKAVYYVDAEHGNDSWDGTADYENRDESAGHGPKLSLQAAHDAAATGTDSAGYPIVIAAPGLYTNGVTTTYDTGTSYPCKRRLVATKQIGFIAAEGPDSTFIVGAPDPATGGCGPDAISGIQSSSGYYQFFQGFTITGCYSPSSQGKPNQYGSAFYGSGRAGLLDCVISNNYAVSFSGTYSGFVQRSRFLENVSTNYVAMYTPFTACIFAGNRITAANSQWALSSLVMSLPCYFCTFDLHNARNPSGRNRLANDDANLYGCIAYGLTDKSRTSTTHWRDSKAIDNPLFADAENRDYRLGTLSPAIDAVPYSGMVIGERRSLVSDIDGRMPVVNGGMARLGAVWNEPALPVTVIAGSGSGIAVVGTSEGTNIVSSADEITVTATQATSRPFVGFEVNGEMVSNPGATYSFTPATAAGSVTSVRAIYETEWYVDCANGNDANSGKKGHPKRTIRAATTNAISGDIIHVAPGTYGAEEGSQKWPNETSEIGTRVVIPDGVTLVSTDGAEKTFIVGAVSPEPAVTTGWQTGIGPGAVRCVRAGDGAVLRGFTLTGGYTHAITASLEQDRYASAFYASARTATMEDCMVSNNVGAKYTITSAIVRRCRVIGNTVAASGATDVCGAAGSSCAWYNSIFANNRGVVTLYSSVAIENCTIGSGNIYDEDRHTAQVVFWWDAKDHAIFNSAILAGRYYCTAPGKICFTNCLVMAEQLVSDIDVERSCNTIFTNSAAAKVDSEYRPILGQFVGIDKGDAAFSTAALGDTDILGTPRVLNGAIDMGAVEYDWRPTFNAELGRRFKLTYVSPSVTTNVTGGLLMPDGAVAGTASSAGPYEISFTLTGGSLAVYVGGELADESSGTGEQSIRFTVANNGDEIRFVYTPEAGSTAVLTKFSGARGFSVRLR